MRTVHIIRSYFLNEETDFAFAVLYYRHGTSNMDNFMVVVNCVCIRGFLSVGCTV